MKGFISKIFQKSYDDLKISDVEDFFKNPQDETGILEFKSGEVQLSSIYQEVCAFLNTEGGLIIIGAPRKVDQKVNDKHTIEIYQGELTYSKFPNKDWLYQKINANVVPSPVSVRIREFIIPDKGAIFLIDVPQSVTPPHQSESEGKYYIRMDRMAKPAPHGLVQALFEKRKKPKLTVEVNIEFDEYEDKVNVSFSFSNKSSVPAESLSYTIDFYGGEINSSEYKESDYNNTTKSTRTHTLPILLPRLGTIEEKVSITHSYSKFLFFVTYWCKDVDTDFYYGTINPIEKKLESLRGNDLSENDSFIEFYSLAKKL